MYQVWTDTSTLVTLERGERSDEATTVVLTAEVEHNIVGVEPYKLSAASELALRTVQNGGDREGI